MPEPDMNEGEILWISRTTHALPGFPDGFAFLVDQFLGRDQRGWVYLAGRALSPATGMVVAEVQVCVPLDHPRAVRTNQGASFAQTGRGVAPVNNPPVNKGPASEFVRPYVDVDGQRYKRMFTAAESGQPR